MPRAAHPGRGRRSRSTGTTSPVPPVRSMCPTALPVERQVQAELGEDDLRQEARAGAAAADRVEQGGFKWSSQHLDGGGCDEGWETALGSGATSRVAGVAWPTRRGAAGEPAAVLGGDCGGSVERGRGDRGRRVARGGGPLVPGGGRHATDDTCAIREATLRAVSGVR